MANPFDLRKVAETSLSDNHNGNRNGNGGSHNHEAHPFANVETYYASSPSSYAMVRSRSR